MENKVNSHNKKREYLLSNPHLQVHLSSYGAGVRSIYLKYQNSVFKNIALTLESGAAYGRNPLYAGATLAPAAGRLEHGRLRLDGDTYSLDRNENGTNHLHGGTHNLSFCDWNAEKITDTAVRFSSTAPDGLDGYPGCRSFYVEYSINGRQLEIRQYARSDRETYFNLSNHTYFNLNAFSRSGTQQYLAIRARRAAVNDRLHIPRRIVDATDTELDFQNSTLIQEQCERFSGSRQLQYAKGLNHYFLLENEGNTLPGCTLLSLDKKVRMELFTDAPAIVVYTGGFIDPSLRYQKEEAVTEPAYPGCAIALEPSREPVFDGNVRGMKEFSQKIVYRFSGEGLE